jgi:hypothetical protein
VYHWVREAFVIELVGTCMGCLNVFWWGSGAVGQLVSASIIEAYGRTEDGAYSEEGYRVGLWWMSLALTAVSVVPAAFMKYEYPEPAMHEEDAPDQEESKSGSNLDEL